MNSYPILPIDSSSPYTELTEHRSWRGMRLINWHEYMLACAPLNLIFPDSIYLPERKGKRKSDFMPLVLSQLWRAWETLRLRKWMNVFEFASQSYLYQTVYVFLIKWKHFCVFIFLCKRKCHNLSLMGVFKFFKLCKQTHFHAFWYLCEKLRQYG